PFWTIGLCAQLWMLLSFHAWPFEHLFHATTVRTVEFGGTDVVLIAPALVKRSGILVHQMSILGTAGTTKVFHLHHRRQHRLVEVILQRGLGKVSLQHMLVLV